MKKTFNVFIIIFLLSFVVLPKISFAAVTLVANQIERTSAVLDTTGLTPQTRIILTVDNKNGTPAYHFSPSMTMTDFDGIASGNFLALTPGGQYVATVAYFSNPSVILKSINFSTLQNVALSISNISQISATITLTNLENSPSYAVHLIKKSNNSIAGTKFINSQTNGSASVVFADLSASTEYLVRVDRTMGVTIPNVLNGTFSTLSGGNVKITSFTPVQGISGDVVVIFGENLTGIKNVSLANINTTFFPKDSSSIQMNVPAGATTGKIRIETESNGSVTSVSNFTISTVIKPPPTSDNDAASNQDAVDLSNNGDGLAVGCGENGCGFYDLFKLINNVITFILFDMALPIAAIMFTYAGILLIFSGGESSKRTKAKSIFLNVVIGLVIAVACFLIVKTILSIAGYNQTDINWFGL